MAAFYYGMWRLYKPKITSLSFLIVIIVMDFIGMQKCFFSAEYYKNMFFFVFFKSIESKIAACNLQGLHFELSIGPNRTEHKNCALVRKVFRTETWLTTLIISSYVQFFEEHTHKYQSDSLQFLYNIH